MAKAKGIYTPPSFNKEGFIHCSMAHQIIDVAEFNFKNQNNLVLLEIDLNQLQSPVKFEDLYESGEDFPHIYGALNLEAVSQVFSFPTPFQLPAELKKSFPFEIKGKRIILKKHNEDLAGTMFASIDEDRKRLRKFLPWVDSTKSKDDSLEYLKLAAKWWLEASLFDYGIYTIDGIYMGGFGVHNIAWAHNRAELGYWINGKYEGQGYVSEAAKLIEEVLWGLGFNRIEIRCSSANIRSANLPQKNGYTLEGTLRQECIEQGEYRDTLIFAKLRSD